jgi:hypothetical protein
VTLDVFDPEYGALRTVGVVDPRAVGKASNPTAKRAPTSTPSDSFQPGLTRVRILSRLSGDCITRVQEGGHDKTSEATLQVAGRRARPLPDRLRTNPETTFGWDYGLTSRGCNPRPPMGCDCSIPRDYQLTDELWAVFGPLLPPERSHRRGGRPRAEARRCMGTILLLLRAGIPWKAVRRCFGASSNLHDRFQEWQADGVFERMCARSNVLPNR